jgi:hypothetical protein
MYPIHINKIATDREAGRCMEATIDWEHDIGPRFKSPPGYIFFLANLANFHVVAILAISTYIKPNIWFQKGDI